jgi:hypothetical protein
VWMVRTQKRPLEGSDRHTVHPGIKTMRAILIALSLLLAAATAEASTRSYFAPKAESQPISACLADGLACGKQAADAFCQQEGFKESILFARETVAKARILNSEKFCEGNSCEAFKRIKCYMPVATSTE